MRPFAYKKIMQLMVLAFLVSIATSYGQEEKKKPKPVKNTFNGVLLGDNQTVMVPIKKTLELDIMHRFGTWKKGYEDFFGLFASSNIRLGASYSFLNNLNVGMGITKANMTWDVEAKYSLIKQTKGRYPVSISYYASMKIDSREKENFINYTDRFSYFHQLLIARKLTDNLSVQVAPSLSHINSVNGFYNTEGKVKPVMKHEHFAIALMGRYKLKETMALFFNYDQPITKHVSNNPHPNIQLGVEMSTSAHSFQFFAGNYASLNQVRNNMFNKNDYTKGEFLIGFNITRLWNY